MSDEHMIIDEKNFDQYFFDVRINKPQKNQVLVKYSAMAELVYGDLKQDIVKLLKISDFGAKTSIQIMKKLGKANEKEALRVVKAMCCDLFAEMTDDEVLAKPYKYVLEMCFFTKREHVPPDDLHWEVLAINNLEDYLSLKETYTRNEDGILTKKIVISEEDIKNKEGD